MKTPFVFRNKRLLCVAMAMLFITAATLFLARPAAAFDKTTKMVSMPDGVKLATDVYIPKSKTKMPAVLMRTPYGKNNMASMLLPFFNGKRVVLVIQDTRGRHDSEGTSACFIDAAPDGYETVEWIARQPWSNGKVGTMGISAMGITQYLMHKKPPEHLVCQNVMAAPESLYDTIVYQGGGVRRALFYGWVLGQNFPIEVMELILSQVDYSDVWRQLDLSVDYDKVNVPIMHMSGWYDLYLRGNIEAFVNIQEKGGPGARGRQLLVIGPWTHGKFLGFMGTEIGDLAYPDNAKYSPLKIVDWFKECFYERDYGFLSGPAVTYYVMGATDDPGAPGNEWRTADSWPVPAENTTFYFHKDGTLSTEKPGPDAGGLSFMDDPADPVPTLGSRAHSEQRHPVDLRPIEERDDVLVFTTPVLDEPVEITGHIKAVVSFTTDVIDTDFNIRITDVYPDGRSMLVTDGIARASHKESYRYRKYMTPGETYEMEVEVWPTSLIFNKGHRIRVVVSGTNFPRFDVNHHNGRYHNISPGELEQAKKDGVEEYVYTPDVAPDSIPANTTLHVNAVDSSYIVLPVVKD